METNNKEANNFIKQFQEQAAAKKLLTPERITGQLNKKSFAKVSGKAAEYKKQLSTCKFKLVVYFNQDAAGRHFTQADKDLNRNRQYIPSFDYVNKGGRLVVNEEIGHVQLIDYCLQNAARIQAARMIWNDYINEEEKTIFVFNPTNIYLSKFIMPIFKLHELSGGTFISGLEEDPIRIDKMRIYDNN